MFHETDLIASFGRRQKRTSSQSGLASHGNNNTIVATPNNNNNTIVASPNNNNNTILAPPNAQPHLTTYLTLSTASASARDEELESPFASPPASKTSRLMGRESLEEKGGFPELFIS